MASFPGAFPSRFRDSDAGSISGRSISGSSVYPASSHPSEMAPSSNDPSEGLPKSARPFPRSTRKRSASQPVGWNSRNIDLNFQLELQQHKHGARVYPPYFPVAPTFQSGQGSIPSILSLPSLVGFEYPSINSSSYGLNLPPTPGRNSTPALVSDQNQEDTSSPSQISQESGSSEDGSLQTPQDGGPSVPPPAPGISKVPGDKSPDDSSSDDDDYYSLPGGLRPPPPARVPAAVDRPDQKQDKNSGYTSPPPSTSQLASPTSTLAHPASDHGSGHQGETVGSSRLPHTGTSYRGGPQQPTPQDNRQPLIQSPTAGHGSDQPQEDNTRENPSATTLLQKQKYSSLLNDFEIDEDEPPGPIPRTYDRDQDPEVKQNTYQNEHIDVPNVEVPAPKPAGEGTNRDVNFNPTAEIQNSDGAISVEAISDVDNSPGISAHRPDWIDKIRKRSEADEKKRLRRQERRQKRLAAIREMDRMRPGSADEETRLRRQERRRQRLIAIRDTILRMKQRFRSTIDKIFGRNNKRKNSDRHANAGHPENPEEKNPLLEENPLNLEPSPLDLCD